MKSDEIQNLLPPTINTDINSWLREDLPSFDIGGAIVGTKMVTARLLGKSSGILAGQPFFTRIFEYLGCQVQWSINDGDKIDPIQEIATVTGPANKILQGERLGLNLLSRLSGIATLARSLVSLKEQHGFTGVIAGTRKTTPGLRLYEKYALLIGGADTHRLDLSHMVMLKDNHIKARGSISQAIKDAKQLAGFSTKIEVECKNEHDAYEAIKAGADIIMLDNFNPESISHVAPELKKLYPHVIIEVSGGITPQNITKYFINGVDVISLGYLTHHITSLDFSLKL